MSVPFRRDVVKMCAIKKMLCALFALVMLSVMMPAMGVGADEVNGVTYYTSGSETATTGTDGTVTISAPAAGDPVPPDMYLHGDSLTFGQIVGVWLEYIGYCAAIAVVIVLVIYLTVFRYRKK